MYEAWQSFSMNKICIKKAKAKVTLPMAYALTWTDTLMSQTLGISWTPFGCFIYKICDFTHSFKWIKSGMIFDLYEFIIYVYIHIQNNQRD